MFESSRSIERDYNHLGYLQALLRGLVGFDALAFELIQNADDAEAKSVQFSVTQSGLIVSNSGSFRACDDPEAKTCSFKAQKGHYCDFHRFKELATGDKRHEAETTGAFGVGFVSVYQVTDNPELVSAGRHWRLDEVNRRIDICPGCPSCKADGLPGTQFLLPWALDPNSELRVGLEMPPPDVSNLQGIAEDISSAAERAAVFLKSVEHIEVVLSGGRVFDVRREQSKSHVRLSGSVQAEFDILLGAFKSEASELRKQFLQIESKRSASIRIAVPRSPSADFTGYCYATLPTETETGLPLHVQADFFPTTDRRHLILTSDFQSKWNNLAIKRAFAIIGEQLEDLRAEAEPSRCLCILARSQAAQRELQGVFASSWAEISRTARSAKIVRTRNGDWVRPGDCTLIASTVEEAEVELLNTLGLFVVDRTLVEHSNLLQTLGAKHMRAADLRAILLGSGFRGSIKFEVAMGKVGGDQGLHALWTLVGRLASQGTETFEDCALAPGGDVLVPCEDVFTAEPEAIAAFSNLSHGRIFLSEEAKALRPLCHPFTPADAIEIVRTAVSNDQIKDCPRWFFEWLKDHRLEWHKNAALKQQIASLPIYPSAGALAPLSDLSLPGSFTDPVGFSGVVDDRQITGFVDLLTELGARPLSLERYFSELIPDFFRSSQDRSVRLKALSFLAGHTDFVSGNTSVRSALANAPLVECDDELWRKPREVYFPEANARDVLGKAVAQFKAGDHQESLSGLYRVLGVSRSVRLSELVERANELAAGALTPDTKRASVAIFRHAARRLARAQEAEKETVSKQLEPLQSMKWLPVEGSGQWHHPMRVFATYSKYLFESQGTFLDVDAPTQGEARALIGFLDIQINPSVQQVVAHLIHLATAKQDVNSAIYTFLMQHHADTALRALVDKPVFQCGDHWFRAKDIFWTSHPFGRFRAFAPSLAGYSELLGALDASGDPSWKDAFDVLTEVAATLGKEHSILDEETIAVVDACWSLLDGALANEPDNLIEVLRELRDAPCVVNRQRILRQPNHLLLNDYPLVANAIPDLDPRLTSELLQSYPALRQAGVRSLRAVTRRVRHGEENGEVNPELTNHLRKLMPALARLCRAHASLDRLDGLENLVVRSVPSLAASFELNTIPPFKTSPEGVRAFLDTSTSTLYCLDETGDVDVAREFALALAKDDGQLLYFALRAVIGSRNLEEAHRQLDEAGVPEATVERRWSVEPLVVESFGSATAAEDEDQFRAETEESEWIDEEASSVSESHLQEEREGDEATLESDEHPLHSDGQPAPDQQTDSRPVAWRQRGQGGHSGIRDGGGQVPDEFREPGEYDGPPRRTGSRQNAEFPAYVGHEPDDRESRDSEGRKSNPIDRAGIARVLELEEREGRTALEMDQMNPGYDIESMDSDGRTRFIEVKSLDATWGTGGKPLSPRQHEAALEFGDSYWLYVVERACHEDAQIYCIQDPAAKITGYFFSSGWKAAAQKPEGEL